MDEASQESIPALNKAHDRRQLARVFASFGRIHIPSILTPESAGAVQNCLQEKTRYNLVVNSGSKVFDIAPEDFEKLSASEKADLVVSANEGAKHGFQYIYENCRLSEAGEPFPDEGHYLSKVVSFLNSQEFLSFVRAVTGETKIALADAQATRYGAGHFLTTHNDHADGKKRLAAFVLNMTPRWHPDWGGNLLFLNSQGQIAEGYVPTFNALNLLKVPQPHCVSQVSSFAGAHRYSITGWLRAR
jgi:Rps23 Pro-64 3,4-dihydroxylase Tpa1-like proline 4-hydroxylase